jgi:putative CocE/NonD family hydrolase
MSDSPIIRDVTDSIRRVELAWIPMSDGRRLAATLWLPNDAEQRPVPAILEYIPYRRRDGTRFNDEETHAWFAAQGYACARVDLAGSGDSDGLLRDEYLPEEQDDALEVIAWLAAQPWCSGSVGMIGISWGGFAGLQVAARQPPALKAVITVCSTVDRYNDDVHYMGGCLLNTNLEWGAVFLDVSGLPPDPAMVAPDWQKRWLERLEMLHPFPAIWLEHQRRDSYWRHGSVCENYDLIETPVLAVGGWADGYTSAVFDLVENLKSPCKGIVGPWGHLYPHRGIPGPAIGFLQECVRWWDRWLKNEPNGVESDPLLRLWLQDWVPPQPHHDQRPGRWITFEEWPPKETKLTDFRLETGDSALTVHSPQGTGLAGGEWCPYVFGKVGPEVPLDQRDDDEGSLVFDFEPLTTELTLVGAPVAVLSIAVDQPEALVAVRLSDVSPDGQVARVSFGLLNLSHRDGHAEPRPLEPGKRYSIRIPLKESAHVFASGHRLRVSLSTGYWPMVWPSPSSATVSVQPGDNRIELPIVQDRALRIAQPFGPVDFATAMRPTLLEPGGDSREVSRDPKSGLLTQRIVRDDGVERIDHIGTKVAYIKIREMSIIQDDPLSAREAIDITHHFRRNDWDARLQTRMCITCDEEHFFLDSEVIAYSGEARIFHRSFHHEIRRDHM